MNWKQYSLGELEASLATGLLFGWENPKPLLQQHSEFEIIRTILTSLCAGKEIGWYHPELHDWENLPPEVEPENVVWSTIYDSWGLGMVTYNSVEISACCKFIAVSLNGCSGQSALTEYIKIS